VTSSDTTGIDVVGSPNDVANQIVTWIRVVDGPRPPSRSAARELNDRASRADPESSSPSTSQSTVTRLRSCPSRLRSPEGRTVIPPGPNSAESFP
jgi:hypothetical protein